MKSHLGRPLQPEQGIIVNNPLLSPPYTTHSSLKRLGVRNSRASRGLVLFALLSKERRERDRAMGGGNFYQEERAQGIRFRLTG